MKFNKRTNLSRKKSTEGRTRVLRIISSPVNLPDMKPITKINQKKNSGSERGERV